MCDSSFAVDTPAWDDADMMMEDDNNSVIDGVVDDNFLMMLDDDEAEASLSDDQQFRLEDNDIDLDLTDSNHDDDLDGDDDEAQDNFQAPEGPVSSHHFASSSPPQRGVHRHYSEGITPSHHQFPQRTFSAGPTGTNLNTLQQMQQHQHHLMQQQQQQHPESPRRGVTRHFSEHIPSRGAGLSRAFSERIPERIPETTPSFYSHHHSQEAPTSPVPNEINIFANPEDHSNNHNFMNNNTNTATQLHPTCGGRAAPTFRVTPEPSNSSISLPDPYDLQVQYQRTLQRLGKSMRRSDATRSIVKRQRSGYSTCSNLSTESEVSGNHFAACGDQQVEEARRRLFQLTQQG